MRRMFAASVLAALLVAPAAYAKGPDYALLSNPGIDGSIRIDGDGENGAGTPLGALATYGGLASQVFGLRRTLVRAGLPRPGDGGAGLPVWPWLAAGAAAVPSA